MRPSSSLPTGEHAASARCAKVTLGDGLDVVVLGSGGPLATGRGAASYLIGVAGVPRLLVDVGPGSFVRLGESGLTPDKIDTVLLTHLHIDHAGDLPAFVKSRNVQTNEPVRLRVVGPIGAGPYPSTSSFVTRLFGPEGAFAYLASFRNPLALESTDLSVDLDAPPHEVLREGELRVTSVAVDHGEVPALAYRIEYGKHSVVISGDLASKHTRLVELARGADVLVYDAAVLDAPDAPPKLYELHTPPARIGEVAQEAGVKLVVLSHITPATEAGADKMLDSVRAEFRGEVKLALDCQHVATNRRNASSP